MSETTGIPLDIRVGQVGRIAAGDQRGWYLRVDDDAENTGGFLILTCRTPDMTDCFDGWAENKQSLEQYFIESGWRILWITDPQE